MKSFDLYQEMVQLMTVGQFFLSRFLELSTLLLKNIFKWCYLPFVIKTTHHTHISDNTIP